MKKENYCYVNKPLEDSILLPREELNLHCAPVIDLPCAHFKSLMGSSGCTTNISSIILTNCIDRCSGTDTQLILGRYGALFDNCSEMLAA